MERECLYHPKTGTETIQYRINEDRVLWARDKAFVEIALLCRVEDEFDDLYGQEMPVFAPAPVDRFDLLDLDGESEPCILLFGPDGKHEDDNPVGIAFRIGHLSRKPVPGETVKAYILAMLDQRERPHIMEKALPPYLFERFGDIEIIPKREPVMYVDQ